MKASLKSFMRGELSTAMRPLLVGFIEGFFRIRQSYPLWFYVLNHTPRTLFQKHPPRLNEVQTGIVRALKDTGMAVTHVDALFPGENLLPLLVSHAQALRDQAEMKTGKTFLDYLTQVATY